MFWVLICANSSRTRSFAAAAVSRVFASRPLGIGEVAGVRTAVRAIREFHWDLLLAGRELHTLRRYRLLRLAARENVRTMQINGRNGVEELAEFLAAAEGVSTQDAGGNRVSPP
jgi:hypothetical protein